MKVSFFFAILSAATAVVALPATGTVNEVSNVVERAAAVKATTTTTTAAAKATTTTKPKTGKKIKVKPEVVPTAIKPLTTPASKSPKWSKNTHPKENVPKDFGKKKTGK